MKLAAKLVLSVVAGVVLILTIDTTMSVRREIRTLEDELRREAEVVGLSFRGLVADVWRSNGSARVMELIADANESQHDIRVRWVWFDGAGPPDSMPRLPAEDLGSLRSGTVRSFDSAGAEEVGFIATYVPIETPGGRRGGLELTQSRKVLEARISSTVGRAVLLSGTMLIIGGMAILFIGVGLVGRPLRAIIEKTRRIGEGDLDGPIDVPGRDELSSLAESINEMCLNLSAAREAAAREAAARITALEDLRHADRLTTVGRLAAGVAHELGTPLNVVTGRASMIDSGRLSPEEIRECANIIRSQGERMTRIIRQLLEFGRRSPPRRETVSVDRLVGETIALVRPLCDSRSVVRYEAERGFTIDVDAGQIQQVLVNLVMNGLQCGEAGVEVVISVEGARASSDRFPEERPCLRIDVTDDGPGIPADVAKRIFEPFFTTKDVGVGTGLGLSVAHGIVEDHDGWIEVASDPGRGTRFSVFLPRGDSTCLPTS